MGRGGEGGRERKICGQSFGGQFAENGRKHFVIRKRRVCPETLVTRDSESRGVSWRFGEV